MVRTKRWNWNIHHHRLVLDAIPSHATNALDVGSGDGLLSFDLSAMGLEVTGVEIDEPSIQRAHSSAYMRSQTQFILADVLNKPFAIASFDVVASIAMLHHIDARLGLRSMKQLVKPQGVLIIVGLAKTSDMYSHALGNVGGAYKRLRQLFGMYWEHHSPMVWPLSLNMREMEWIVYDELPGAQFRRLLSSRYGVIWYHEER